jgi:hypothetical protein
MTKRKRIWLTSNLATRPFLPRPNIYKVEERLAVAETGYKCP